MALFVDGTASESTAASDCRRVDVLLARRLLLLAGQPRQRRRQPQRRVSTTSFLLSLAISLLLFLCLSTVSASTTTVSASTTAVSNSTTPALSAPPTNTTILPEFFRELQSQNVTTASNPALCGNGILDAGEECDPGDAVHGACCSSVCTRLPELKHTCVRDKLPGVCYQGQCVHRESQCARMNERVLMVGTSAIQGPYVPCNPSVGGAGMLRNVENTCTLACHGNAILSRSDPVCLDLQMYANVPPAVVPDGLLCGGDAFNSPLGLCMSGSCVNAACRRLRCANHGDCTRSKDGTNKCRCDSQYSGDMCNLREDCPGGIVDTCGVCNGTDTTCNQSIEEAPQPFLQSNTFRYIVLPVGCSLFIIIVALVILLVMRHKKNAQYGAGGILTSHYFKSKLPHKLGISVSWDEYRCIHEYEATMPDELDLIEGDILFKLFEYDDGWAKGYNTRTQEEGIYPISFTQKVNAADASGRRLSTPGMIGNMRKESTVSSKRSSSITRNASRSASRLSRRDISKSASRRRGDSGATGPANGGAHRKSTNSSSSNIKK